MKHNRYHKFLRISALVAGFVLVFDGGFLAPITKQLSDNTISYLGSVHTGVFASVEPNEINTITAELTARERALDERERAIEAREFDPVLASPGTGPDYSTYILSSILFILTVLIVLNYAMDWARARQLYDEHKAT